MWARTAYCWMLDWAYVAEAVPTAMEMYGPVPCRGHTAEVLFLCDVAVVIWIVEGCDAMTQMTAAWECDVCATCWGGVKAP